MADEKKIPPSPASPPKGAAANPGAPRAAAGAAGASAASGASGSAQKTAPAAKAAAKPKPAAPPPMNPALAGKTTSAAAGARKAPPKKAAAKIDDTSPLMGRRGWLGLAWGSFTAATAGCLAATGRFMFPNVLNEPPQQFTIGFPTDYSEGVDERWKDAYGVWVVRTPFEAVHEEPGFYALLVTCTHLGCTPNYLAAEAKFKCPCHGSGFRETGINFEGPAPRPLERARIVLAEDGQILIDKSQKYQEELGQWTDPESFLAV
jgi:cytochrome b6-f complex iron-sulfur subunit